MKLSVILVVNKIDDILDKCIESINKQTEKSIELILACNKELSKELKEKYKHASIISKDTSKYESLVNEGIRKSKGEYISIIDSHMVLNEKMYENMLFQRADICSCSYIENGNIKHQELYSKLASLIKIDDNIENKMFKKSLIINTLFSLDDDVLSKKLFIYKAVALANTYGFVPEISYDIRRQKEKDDYTKIYKTLDEITKYYKIKNLYDKEKSKLEYIHVREILINAFNYLRKTKNKELLNKNWNYLNEKYPTWKKNLYVKRMPGIKSLTLRLTDKFIYDIKSKMIW